MPLSYGAGPSTRKPMVRALAGAGLLALAVFVAFTTRRPARVSPTPAPPSATIAPARSAPPPSTLLSPRPSPARGVPKPPPITAPPKAPLLRVESDVPGASVFVDRRFVGKAPVDVSDVTPGPHRVHVSAEGFEMQAEEIEIGEAPVVVSARFKDIRLAEAIDVIHKHGIGSCRGRLSATPSGLRFEASAAKDSWSAPLQDLERFEVDYLKNTLRLSLRGGRSYTFTTDAKSADPLLVFQQKVDKARKRISAN